MKNSKKMTLAAMLLSSVVLTGCFFQDVPSHDGDSSSTSSPTKSLSPQEIKGKEAKIDEKYKPTEAPKIEMDESQKPSENLTDSQKEELNDIKDEMSSAPLGMDISKIELPEVVKGTFPESDFNFKEGIRVALNTYQNMSSQTNLYAPRDTSKDWEMFAAPYSSSMMSYFADDLKESISKRDSTGENKHLLYSDKDGVLISLSDENLIPAGTPYTTYGDPVVDSVYNNNYDLTTGKVSFFKYIEFRATNGHSYKVKDEVAVFFAPVGENEWYVVDMWHTLRDVQEVK